jgi:antitoxin ChpS
MSTVKLRNLGGSVVLAVPKKVLEAVDLSAGSAVKIHADRGRLIIEPQRTRHYTLAQLLKESRASDFSRRAADREWLLSAPVGRELL